jgi:plastocyanin
LDPEQIYQEVLQEEKGKGVSPAVAEGRAKAARVRAEHGSPHPKEARWWPGSQPQFEGGDGAAPAEVEAEPAAEEAEAPAATAPAEEPAPESTIEQPAAQPTVEQPAAQAPAEEPVAPAPAAEQPAPAPAERPAAAAVATVEATAAPTQTATVGVQPGVPAGNRLRPEDAVSTEAQFDGQRAMEQRRKLIDELVATGVPAVTAAQTGRERSPWISILFLVVPLLAVLLIVSNSENLGGESAASGGGASASNGGGGAPPEGTIVAEQTAFNTDTINLKADEPASITFENKDPFDHNIAIYENQADADAQENAIFQGDHISATTTTYEFDAPPKGEYLFQCDLHPTTMNGTVVVE